MVVKSSFLSSLFDFFKTPPNTCRLFSRPISAVFNVFSFFLSPIYLLSLPPPLSLSISPFGLNSWCTIFVSVYCCLPGLPFSLSLFLSCLLALLLHGQSIRVIGQLGLDPRGRGVERERRCEKERENTKNKVPKKMRQNRSVTRMQGHWDLSPRHLCPNKNDFL